MSKRSSFSSLSAALRFLKTGLLGVLEISEQRSAPALPAISIALTLLSIFQMFSFVTANSSAYDWPQSLAPLSITSSLTSVSGYRAYMSTNFSVALVWASFAWVGLLGALIVWGIACFAANEFPVLWPLTLLKVAGNLSAGVLFIPLLQAILQTSCSEAQQTTCSHAGDVAEIILSIVATIFLVCLSFIFNGIYYDASVWSKNVRAQAHGRFNIVMLAVQLVLVVTMNVVNNSAGLPGGMQRIIVLASMGFVWLAAVLFFMPYYQHFMNRLWVVGAFVYLSAVVALTFDVYVPTVDAALLLYVMFPLAVGCGIALADARATNIICALPERLSTPYEIELKGRYMLHAAVFGHALFSIAGTNAMVRPAAHHAATVVPASGGGDNELPQYLSPEDAAKLLNFYRAAVTRFSGDPIVHLFMSRMYGHVLNNRHMQMSVRRRAQTRTGARRSRPRPK